MSPPPKYITIENPFELYIGGINNYEGLHVTIKKWLYYKYVHDDKSSHIFDTHISQDCEYFIFTIDSWELTLIVLKDTEAFHTYFANTLYLTDPKLLFESNSSGFTHKSTTTIDSVAGAVNNMITDLKHKLTNFCKKQNENNSMVQCQVAAIHVNMENQTNAVALIGSQLQQFGLLLLASHDEKAIEGRIYAINNNIFFEIQCLQTKEDPTEKAVINTNITLFQNEWCEQAQLLVKVSDVTLKLIRQENPTSQNTQFLFLNKVRCWIWGERWLIFLNDKFTFWLLLIPSGWDPQYWNK